MKRTPVKSSNLRDVGYVPKDKLLEVGFQSGHVYQFTGVHSNTHRALMAAPSKGKSFWKNVRGKYPFSKVS